MYRYKIIQGDTVIIEGATADPDIIMKKIPKFSSGIKVKVNGKTVFEDTLGVYTKGTSKKAHKLPPRLW